MQPSGVTISAVKYPPSLSTTGHLTTSYSVGCWIAYARAHFFTKLAYVEAAGLVQADGLPVSTCRKCWYVSLGVPEAGCQCQAPAYCRLRNKSRACVGVPISGFFVFRSASVSESRAMALEEKQEDPGDECSALWTRFHGSDKQARGRGLWPTSSHPGSAEHCRVKRQGCKVFSIHYHMMCLSEQLRRN